VCVCVCVCPEVTLQMHHFTLDVSEDIETHNSNLSVIVISEDTEILYPTFSLNMGNPMGKRFTWI